MSARTKEVAKSCAWAASLVFLVTLFLSFPALTGAAPWPCAAGSLFGLNATTGACAARG